MIMFLFVNKHQLFVKKRQNAILTLLMNKFEIVQQKSKQMVYHQKEMVYYQNKYDIYHNFDFGLINKFAPDLMQTKNEVMPKPLKSKKGKKIIDEQLIARFEKQSKEPHQSSGRRRLKKLNEVNESQEILSMEEPNEQKLDQPLEEVVEYKQFKVQDDEDLKREKERQQEAKKNKKLKGNQQLDKFLEKVAKPQLDKSKKQEKIKISKNEWTPEQLERIKKEKKKRRKSSDDFLQSDNGNISQQDEKFIEARRIAAYQAYNNGSIDDQKKLIQKALRLSLTPTTKQEEYIVQEKIQQKIRNVPKHSNFKGIEQNSKKEVANNSTLEYTENKVNPFDGLFITIAGQFDSYEKDQLIEVIQRLGGVHSSKLTKKCNLVIYGQYAINNFKKRTNQSLNQTNIGKQAQERNIQIVANQKINSFFLQKTGNSLEHYLRKKAIIPDFSTEPLKLEEIIPEKNSNIEIKESKILNQPVASKKQNQTVNKNQIFSKQPAKQKQQKMEIQYPKPQTTQNDKLRDYQMWTQKYKPISLEDVIGQNNQIKSLCQWLQSWEDIQVRGNKREVKDGRGWNAAGSINSKAALLSGDPGIGKTTTARLIAAKYNYKITEFNASDVRNKSGIDLMPSGTHSLNTSNTETMLTKRLIIMDEVDGMSSGDRGGIAAIINMIKNTKAPIICICNDRTCDKIRSLAGHCLDVKFQKPQKSFVVTRLKSILSRQGGSGEDRALEQLVDTFQNDMRQILSYLEIIFKTVSKNITFDVLKHKNQHAKDASVMINHHEATRTLLNRSQFKRMKIEQRVQCFFIDSDIVPLMVHQNILTSTKKTKYLPNQFRSFVQGVHGMVVGDLMDRTIRKQQEWSLMPSYGFMTCVYSTEKISESIGFPQFPSWLGKNSSERKMKRLARELKDYMLPITLCANWKAVKSNYGVLILQELVQMLKKEQIQQACIFLQTYNISPMVLSQNLTVLQYNQQKNSLLAEVPSQIKAKLTRLFNKRHEDLKLKAVKNTKGKVEHIKFDPVLQQASDANGQQEQQASEQQQNDKDVKVKQKQIKNKKK